MSRSQVGTLLGGRRRNAVVGWVVVAFLGASVVGNALGGERLWAGFVAVVLALAVIPPVVNRDWTVMLPWEVLVVAALPAVGRSFATVELTSDLAVYLSVAALALVVAVELHAFTPVRMTYGFAVFFVVVATMATAGTWAVARWSLDVLLGTQFLLEPGVDERVIHDELMFEFVYSTVAGLVGGAVFELYFRRFARIEERLSVEVEEFL